MAVLTLEGCSTNRSPGRLFRRIDKLMSAFVESRFETQDISFMHWVALKLIRDGKGRTAGELARELAITTGAMTRMVDTLEARGLLTRDRGSADRRVVNLSITPVGQKVVTDLQHHVVAAWNEVLVDFDQAEMDRVIGFLIRLLAAAERVVGGDDGIKEASE